MEINRVTESLFYLFKDFVSYITGGSTCIGCGSGTLSLPLCKSCQAVLRNYQSFKIPCKSEFHFKSRCKICGKILVSEIDECSQCRENSSKKNAIAYFPLHSYRLWKKDLMYSWKTENVRSLSFFFAELINSAINSLKKDRNLEFDSIIPVPPRPGKIKKKGWDQVDELCSILKRKYGFKIEYPLERYTRQEQKKLTKDQRINGKGSEYGLRLKKIEGKRVLILDDVITTGATIKKCAFLLKSAGVKEVYGMSLFMVD